MKKYTLLLLTILANISIISATDNEVATEIKSTDTTVEATTKNISEPETIVVSWNDLINNTNSYIGYEVEIHDTLYIISVQNWNKYGEVELSNERQMTPTDVALPGSTEYNTILNRNNTNRIVLSDGLSGIYPNPRPWIDADGTCRTGSYTTLLKGRIASSWNGYSITPTATPVFTGNRRPTTVTGLGNYNLKVCSYNLRYYLASNYGNGYGPDDEADAEKQHNKIIKSLEAIDADIYGLIEVQLGQEALAKITNALNALNNGKHYSYIDDGTKVNGTYTKVGFVYRDDLLEPLRQIQSNNTGVNNRKKGQGFKMKSNNEQIVIMINHFKAKSGQGSNDNADIGDGQGSYNGDRVREATALVTFAQSCARYFGDNDIIIMGDLNAYSQEDPIRVITDAGYTNLIKKYGGEKAYSYVFGGNIGCLDHALTNPSLTAQTTGCQVFHINADESSAFDYYGYSYNDDMYRSSDHDPVVIGFNLNSTTTGIETENSEQSAIIYGENNIIGISNAYNSTMMLYDVNGKILFNTTIETYDYTLDVSTLTNGVYIIQLIDTNGDIQTLKLIRR